MIDVQISKLRVILENEGEATKWREIYSEYNFLTTLNTFFVITLPFFKTLTIPNELKSKSFLGLLEWIFHSSLKSKIKVARIFSSQ